MDATHTRTIDPDRRDSRLRTWLAGRLPARMAAALIFLPVFRAVSIVALYLIAAQAILLFLGVNPAFAQDLQGGSADNILNTGEEWFLFICKCVVYAAGIGIVVSTVIWATSFGNEKRKSIGVGGVVGATCAFVVALLVPDILALGEDTTGNSLGS